MEYDKAQLAGLKMAPVLEEWYEAKSKEVVAEIREVKKDLSKYSCKIDSKSIDGMFTNYSVMVRGRHIIIVIQISRYGLVS